MASGTIDLGTSGYLTGRIVWSATSNGTAANTSTVEASLQVKRTNSYTTTGTWTGSLNIGGTSKSFSTHTGISNSWVEMLAFSKTVSHNDDGSGTCYLYGKISAPTGTSLEGKSVSASQTVNLDKIARKANITAAPNFNDEANPTITYSNPAGNSVDSLKACISLTGAADDIAYRNISKTGTTYTFNLTAAERTVLRNATKDSNSRTVRFYVQTVIDGTTYLSYLEKTLSIVNANPVINPTVIDTNSNTVALTGNNNTMIKYYSNAKITMNASAQKGASLTSKKVVNGSKSLAADGTISAVESNSFVFTAEDSRGNSTTKTVNKTFIDYVKLTCNMGKGTPDTQGNFAFNVSGNCFNGSFGTADNTLEVFYRYKAQGGSYGAWAAMSASRSGNTYEAVVNLTGLDYRTAYVFQAYAKDKLATVYTEEKTIKSLPLFDWDADSFAFHVPVFMDNTKQIWYKDTEGNNILMVSMNDMNQSFFGYGAYNAGLGSTYFDGNSVYIRSKNNINNTASGTIGGNKAWTNSSDARLKEDIRDLPQVFCDIWNELQPKLFRFNKLNGGGNTLYFGLIAQDVIAAFEKYGLDYRNYGFVSTMPIDGVDYFAITYEAYNMITAQVLKNTLAEVSAIKRELAEIR